MLCEYGCGQEALYQLGNGKWCCSESQNKCPIMRKKNSEGNKGRPSPKGMLGKKHSEKARRDISENNSMKNPEFKERHRKAMLLRIGEKRSKESRKKMSKAKKGKCIGENNSHYGIVHTKEIRAKISEKVKNVVNRPEIKAKTSGQDHYNWVTDRNKRFAPYTGLFYNTEYRKTIYKEQNGVCPICGKELYNMNLHHIDFNKQNDQRENLVFVHNSCHKKCKDNDENIKRMIEINQCFLKEGEGIWKNELHYH